MLKINQEKCKKCQICAKNCPIGAITVEPGADGKKVVSITNMCVECNVCRRVCPFGAIDGAEKTEGMVQCHSCSIQCKVPVGSTGACKRYTNEGGRLVRNRALVVEGKPQTEIDPRIAKPVITAVGAGTNYPCIRPAPHIVCEKRDGVDVITTVTEAPLSYSGVLVKLDTNGFRPDAVRRLIDEKLVDYVAMDVKNSRERYAETAGLPEIDLRPVEESIALLKEGRVDYEFRTTVVSQLHDRESLLSLARWLTGAKAWYLQQFVDSGGCIRQGLTAWPEDALRAFEGELQQIMPAVHLRGV